MLYPPNTQLSEGLSREVNPRARAIKRALAETKAIARQQDQPRLTRELQTIAVVRKERIASSRAGERRRLTAVAIGVALVCLVAGYFVGHGSRGSVQIHTIEREAVATAGTASITAIQANSAQPTIVSTQGSEQPGPAVPAVPAITVIPVVPVEPAVPTALEEPVQNAAAAAKSEKTLVLGGTGSANAANTAITSNASNPKAPQQAAALRKVAAKQSLESRPALITQSVDIKPSPAKAQEDAEIVIRQKALVDAPVAAPAVAGSTSGKGEPVRAAAAFKVVNIFDSTVIVRQGQTVRQIKVGEKMPDGQTLKSINADKGQFETMP